MFPYRELFLAVIISLASTLADVLVQPDYQHQSDSNPRYSQPVPQYQINSLSEQYRTEQLPNQESPWYLPRVQNVQTVYPYYESDQGKARSNLVSYPHRSLYNNHYHYSPRPNRPHYAKIGGHGYVRPSVFVGHPQPLIVHRYRRSLESDPTTTESSKSAIVAHDNDVAAKSSLTDVKHSTANDSLLPEHEPTDTNNKRVENRQTKNDHVTMPRLFDLYPENIYSGRYPEYRLENAKIMQQPLPPNPSMPSLKSSEATKTIVPTARQEYCCNDDEDPRLLTNRPYVRWELPLEEDPDTDDDFDNDNRNNNEDPRLLTNRPSVRWESYLQSLDTDDYNTDNKYTNRAASYRQGDSEIFYTMLLHNAIRRLPNSYNQNFVPMRKKYQQAVHQKLENTLQEIINGMGTSNMAKRKQLLDHVTMYIPRNVQLSANLEQPSFTEARTTTGQKKKVLPCPTLSSICNQSPTDSEPNPTEAPNPTEETAVLEACAVRGTTCGQSSNVKRPSSSKPIITTGSCPVLGGSCGQGEETSRYRNNEKLSGINENVDTPYSDKTGISFPFHFPHYPGNYPTYDYSKAISDWDDAEFYNRNSNSAYRINPSKIRIIPNYNDKYYTNINDPNNLAPKIPQTRSQSLDTYNYSPENIQASSDLKYDNTYPSDTQHYDMFSSPVY